MGERERCWLCWSFSIMSTGLGLRRLCLPLDTPFGRRSVVAYSCVTLVEFTGLHNGVPYVFMVMDVIPFFAMLHMVGLCGTAQSPWLLCMYGKIGDKGA